MRTPVLRPTVVVTLLSLALVPAGPAAAAILPAGFIETVVPGLTSPTAMALAPDGRVFIAEQGGAVRIVKAGVLLPAAFLTLTVDSAGERGLIGIALDPAFDSNGFVYVHYTVPGAGGAAPFNRVSRFTASGDTVVPGSGIVIVDLDPLSTATNHNGGAIHFGPDDKLYIGVGDNATGSNAQTLANRKGKVLRLNRDGSIPTDNPFFASATGANRAIWVLGLRNPFTLAFEAGTTRMFINDVGQSAWEEIDQGVAGANYGWPATEGVTTNPAYRSPIYAYGHGTGPTLGCAIAGGAFGRAGPSFPSSYAGDYFFADLCGRWINRRTTAGAVSTFASGIPGPVDLLTAPDGALYYLARGSGGATGILGRITGPPTVPAGAIDATPTTITQPLTVTGWAIDQSAATGTGVDGIQVWAYPNPGSGTPAVFVAAATYGLARSDVATRFGSRFGPSGYSFVLRGLGPGTYLLVVFARSTVTGNYASVSRTVQLRTSPAMAIDIPIANASVRQPFVVAGWAIDRAAVDTGVDAIEVRAAPTGGGASVVIGAATYGIARPDVGAAFGSQFTSSGYQMLVRGLPPGSWQITVSARSTLTGTYTQSRTVTVRVLPSAWIIVDTPTPGSVTSGFVVAGWAIDASAASGTGVDAVHLWAYPEAGGAPVFVGANTAWVARPDVGAIFGSAFTPSGYQIVTMPLASGAWNLVVFARSTFTGTFSLSAVVPVTVR
jgi:glucose/arabinose dehydrogenase